MSDEVETAFAPVDRIAVMADKTQEWIIESVLWPSRPTNWSPCPDHPDSHPLSATVSEAVAVWCCPATNCTVAEVGALPPPAQ
jgi:hypothetical protein